jgi:hypothetical protein
MCRNGLFVACGIEGLAGFGRERYRLTRRVRPEQCWSGLAKSPDDLKVVIDWTS